MQVDKDVVFQGKLDIYQFVSQLVESWVRVKSLKNCVLKLQILKTTYKWDNMVLPWLDASRWGPASDILRLRFAYAFVCYA